MSESEINLQKKEEGNLALSNAEMARFTEIITVLQRNFILQLSTRLTRGHLSFSQLFLLCQLVGNEGMTMSEIASKMSHTMAAATGLVDRLENFAYVDRSRAPTDRRKVLVKITSNGQSIVREIKDEMQKNLTRMTASLEPHEQKTWLTICEKLFIYCDPS
ncbi:MAG: MarR family winged helix-turn-helix transcriptional regulator [Chthoniobacterales bacterium]